MGGHRAAAQFLFKFRTDDGQTVVTSQPNEVFLNVSVLCTRRHSFDSRFMTDDGQTVASSQPNEVFSQS
eukprot:scaffold118139_cov46-Cyclotella_meneghiniana.AAC.1